MIVQCPESKLDNIILVTIKKKQFARFDKCFGKFFTFLCHSEILPLLCYGPVVRIYFIIMCHVIEHISSQDLALGLVGMLYNAVLKHV